MEDRAQHWLTRELNQIHQQVAQMMQQIAANTLRFVRLREQYKDLATLRADLRNLRRVVAELRDVVGAVNATVDQLEKAAAADKEHKQTVELQTLELSTRWRIAILSAVITPTIAGILAIASLIIEALIK